MCKNQYNIFCLNNKYEILLLVNIFDEYMETNNEYVLTYLPNLRNRSTPH